MGLIEFIILCVFVGIIVWATTFLPLPAPVHTIILVAAVFVLLIVLLRAMGVLGGADIPIPQIN